jgi:hypothetical protein
MKIPLNPLKGTSYVYTNFKILLLIQCLDFRKGYGFYKLAKVPFRGFRGKQPHYPFLRYIGYLSMSRKKVVLYNPRCVFHTMPLALLAIGSYLDPEEYEVKIIDGRLEENDSRLLDECRNAICFGVTVLTGAPIYDAIEVTQKVKKQYPEIVTVWGGWHPSLFPEETLEEESIDIVVTGQGELPFTALLKEISVPLKGYGLEMECPLLRLFRNTCWILIPSLHTIMILLMLKNILILKAGSNWTIYHHRDAGSVAVSVPTRLCINVAGMAFQQSVWAKSLKFYGKNIILKMSISRTKLFLPMQTGSGKLLRNSSNAIFILHGLEQ